MKIIKKIVGYLAVVGIGFATLTQITQNNTVYAAEPTTTEQTTVEEGWKALWDFIDMGLNLIYIVVWPIIFLAGIALDNSMVYGSAFNMDAPLWHFWNMTKNFANFALGFIVLFSILKGIFTSFGGDKSKDARSPMSIIKNTLIAGVLIQASWFLTAALIDISTIATYSVGGMPTALIKSDKEQTLNSRKILASHSELEFNNINKINDEISTNWYKIELKDPENTIVDISPCLVKQLGNKTYIVGRKLGGEKFNHTTEPFLNFGNNPENPGERNICVFGNKIYFFNEFPNTINDEDNYYTTLLKNINIGSGAAAELAKCGFFIDLSNKELDNNCDTDSLAENLSTEYETIFDGYEIDSDILTNGILGEDPDTGKEGSWIQTTAAKTINDIIEGSKGFVGPLATIYVSILDFGNLSDTSTDDSIAKNVGNLIIRIGVALGLVFPLIALALILFVRIGYLRIVIAISPFLILLNVFEKTFGIGKTIEKFSLSNILRAIFAPVVTVFALSISVIFMNTLSTSISEENINKTNSFLEWGIETEKSDDEAYTNINIFGYTIAYPKIVDTYAGATGDWFSWMIISFSGIGIMRFVLFAAIGASGVIGKVGESVKSFGENVFKTAPIVPIAGGVGVGTLKETIVDGNYINDYRDKNVVDLGGQKASMQNTLDNIAPSLKIDLDKNGLDSTFNSEEEAEIKKLLQNGNSDGIIKQLQTSKFISKEAGQETDNIKDLYSRSPDFKRMIDNFAAGNNKSDPMITSLFGDKDFLTTQKQISEIGKEIGEKFDSEAALDAELQGIIDLKGITEAYIKDVKVGEDTYKIDVKNGKLTSTKKKQ